MTDNPQVIRQQLRVLRRTLSLTAQRQAALAVAAQLRNWSPWVHATRIAGYWACDGELDPAPLVADAWAAQRPVYLPVLDSASHALHFAPYQPDMLMRHNRFHIPEPDVSPAQWLRPDELELVLMPLVAFDVTGTRLGMGGGYYDRSFAFLRDLAHTSQRPILVGLGYEFQRVAALTRQPWDVPLDAVVTEAALSVFTSAPY